MMQLQAVYRMENYIDTFALGHYARVLSAQDLRTGDSVAFKVLRPEHLLADGDMRWEFRAFSNEACILQVLQDSPHVVKLMDCGFVSSRSEAPSDGEIISFENNIEDFERSMVEYAQKGWRPYLAMEQLQRSDNLFYQMKPTQSGTRRRLPSEDGITLALQFANVLSLAHTQNIVYLDHKLEHVYWNGSTLRIIDFNSSKQLEGHNGDTQEFTKDVHNLCVGILYPAFTGMSPQKTSLRPMPGGQDSVNQRYDSVTDLDFMMEPTLSRGMQDLLRRGAAQKIPTIQDFIYELKDIAARHGRDFSDLYTSSHSRLARDRMCDGLRKLRDGESLIREARDLFRDAACLDDITADLDDELRRLVKEVNEMLNRRVIP